MTVQGNELFLKKYSNQLITIVVIAILYSYVSTGFADTATSIKNGDTIVAVVPKSFPPYYQIDPNQEIEGFAIDVMNALADRLNLTMDYRVKETWQDVLYFAKNDDEFDLIPNIGESEGRREYLNFSLPVETFSISLFARTETATPVFFEYKKIGAVRINMGYKFVSQMDNIEIVGLDSFEQGLFALLAGHIDLLAYPEPVAWRLAKQARQETNIKVVGKPLGEIRRVIGVNKNNPELLRKLNGAITEFVASKEYQQIRDRWFGNPPPFWTHSKIIWSFTVVILLGLALFVLWWHYSVVKLNKELDEKVDKQTKQLKEKILQHERTETALQESNQKLDFILNSLSEVVWAIRYPDQPLFMSKAFEDLYGLAVADWYENQHVWQTLVVKEDRALIEQVNKDIENSKSLHYEYRITKPDGSIIWVLSRIHLIENTISNNKILVGISEDVTTLKNAYLQIEEKQKSLALALTASHAGYYEYEFEKKQLRWDERAKEIHNWQGEEYPKLEELQEILHPDDMEISDRLTTLVKSNQTDWRDNYSIFDKMGNRRYIEVFGFVQRNTDGRAVKLIGTVVDITQRKSAETQLTAAKEQAEFANKAKSEFLARMSHELRTPMNAILGFGQLLQFDKGVLTKEQYESVEHILSGGRHLLKLIDEVLDIAKVDAGKLDMKPMPVSLSESIDSSLLLVKPLADKFNITIDSPEFGTYYVFADKQRLVQVLVNLLSNAIKYSNKNSRVKIVVEDRGRYIRTSIQDQGFGISTNQQKEIFEPFMRGDNVAKGIEGTGIGLAISKKLIKLMNGKIGFESTKGRGSIFWIDLIKESALFESANKLDLNQENYNQFTGLLTILYIEDNLANFTVLKKILQKSLHCEVRGAETAEEGIKIVHQMKPDLIFMDISLPGMDGYGALKILQQDPETKNIPIVALSANAMSKDVQRGLDAGFYDYLTKPIKVDTLISLLSKINKETSPKLLTEADPH